MCDTLKRLFRDIRHGKSCWALPVASVMTSNVTRRVSGAQHLSVCICRSSRLWVAARPWGEPRPKSLFALPFYCHQARLSSRRLPSHFVERPLPFLRRLRSHQPRRIARPSNFSNAFLIRNRDFDRDIQGRAPLYWKCKASFKTKQCLCDVLSYIKPTKVVLPMLCSKDMNVKKKEWPDVAPIGHTIRYVHKHHVLVRGE